MGVHAAAGPKQSSSSSSSSSSAAAASAGSSSASAQPSSSAGGAASGTASAKAGAGTAPSAPPAVEDSSVFVPAEQRLLWKLTARMLRDRRAAFAREQEGSRDQAGHDARGAGRSSASVLEDCATGSLGQSPRASGGRASEPASGASSLAVSPSRLESAGEAQLGQRLHRAVEGLVQDSLGEEEARRRMARRRGRRRGAGGAGGQRVKKAAAMADSSDSEGDDDDDEGEGGGGPPPESPPHEKLKEVGGDMSRGDAGSGSPMAKRRRVQRQH